MPKVRPDELAPYWQTTDRQTVRLYLGDVVQTLKRLPSESVQCVVTSPPYWGLRAYATGDAKYLEIGAEPSPDCGTQGKAQCGRCFVCNMVAVFREVRRVLRDDGTLWLNLGDSYTGGGGYYPNAPSNRDGGSLSARQDDGSGAKPTGLEYKGLPSGNLVGVPWRVALALQADGWILRQDIIWSKPAPMPESVKNRCTKAHEYVFLLVKRQGYFCDMEAIKEKNADPNRTSFVSGSKSVDHRGDSNGTDFNIVPGAGCNKRSVWTVSSPLLKLRSDLTPEQKTYVLTELVRRGLL